MATRALLTPLLTIRLVELWKMDNSTAATASSMVSCSWAVLLLLAAVAVVPPSRDGAYSTPLIRHTTCDNRAEHGQICLLMWPYH